MVATLKVDKIQRVNADSDMISLHDTGVNFAHTPMIGGVGMFSGTFSGQVLQIAGAQDQSLSSHILCNSTSFTDFPLTCSIKVRSTNSILLIQWFSNMMHGASNPINMDLWYQVDPTGGTSFGSYQQIIFYTGSGYTATQNTATGENTFNGTLTHSPYYGWTYMYTTWTSFVIPYWFDHDQTAGSNLRFKMRYRNHSSTATNYMAHQGHNFGWIIQEIGELP